MITTDKPIIENAEIATGCIICQEKLRYSSTPEKATCNVCGFEYETTAQCINGHYICDTCHSRGILGKVEEILLSSIEHNPILLAETIFEMPGLAMHGPEYHSIVPAVIVSAYLNTSGAQDNAKIKEAIRRGKDLKGGSCGFHGNCGAGVGAGIATSIISSATPMSAAPRGSANQATALALLEISKHGGPRCCKREAITSIQSFITSSGYFDDTAQSSYTCKQYRQNKDCIGNKCPYLPILKSIS